MSPDLITAQPRTGSWQHPKLACVATFVVVFLCGAAIGALAMNMGHTRLHREPFWTDTGKVLSMNRLQRELNLTPEQVTQMQSVLDDFAQYYRTVLSDGKTRIYSILNDEQRRKFDEIVKKNVK